MPQKKLQPLAPHRKVVQSIVRAEKARRNLTYKDISTRLLRYGIRQTPSNLGSKVDVGRLEAGLLLAILDVIGVKKLDLPDLFTDLEPNPPLEPAQDSGAPAARDTEK